MKARCNNVAPFLIVGIQLSSVAHSILLVNDQQSRRTHATHDLPKKIWMFWEGPVLPELNRLCIKMWKDLNPSWDLTVIDDNVIKQTFPGLAKIFQEIPRSVSHKADMVRLQWLAKFGGVWADASLLPLIPLDTFVRNLVAPSGFFAYHCESYCHRFPTVASWFLVATPNNLLVMAWRDELLKRWEGTAPTSEKAKSDSIDEDSGQPWAYYEIGYAMESLLVESKVVRDVFNQMPNVSADWPEQCNWGEENYDYGCPSFWTETTSENRPPVLKRPAIIHNTGWLESYHQMLASMNRTRKVTSTGPKTWNKTKWNRKYWPAVEKRMKHNNKTHGENGDEGAS